MIPDNNKKNAPQRHIPAFHVPNREIEMSSAIRTLRQVRHGLEEHSDASLEAISEARNHVDNAITLLKTHTAHTTNNKTTPTKRRELHDTT